MGCAQSRPRSHTSNQRSQPLKDELFYACLLGNLKFVRQCIAEDRDRGQNVDWKRLMETAYDMKHMDIVRYIKDRGRGSVDTQLYYSCLLGDFEFVSKYIVEDKDRGQNVDWERLMDAAYHNKNMIIVRCIRDSGRWSLNAQLNYSCMLKDLDSQLVYSCQLGDMEFVSQCIAENFDRGQNVDWESLMGTAYDHKNMDIVRCIRDSGRVPLNTQLWYSCVCLRGDLEFMTQCIAEDKDRGQNVDWERLMDAAYGHKNMDIVRCIRDSGRVTVYTQLYYSCKLQDLDEQLVYSCQHGDMEFVSQCLAENIDSGQNVDWERLMYAAYNHKNMDIVRCIRESGRVPLNTQLWYSCVCLRGDLEFMTQCIAEDKDRGQNVDWERLMDAAYDHKNMDIVRCIRDSGRVTVFNQLYYSCMLQDLDAQLVYFCQLGDLIYVSQCIADNFDRGQNVDWERLMETAYNNKHTDIVRCIRDNGRVVVDTQLYYSCMLGDLEFMSRYISINKDSVLNVEWERLMKTAYDMKHMDIVHCIRNSVLVSVDAKLQYACQLGDLESVSQCIAKDCNHMDILRRILENGQVSLHVQLFCYCLLGDLESVSQCIAEDRDKGQNVDWERLIETAYAWKHMDIVRCVRDSGRGLVDSQLYYSCLLGDLKFMSRCITNDNDRGQNVDWQRLMETAYNNKHMEVVCCIRDSGRVSVDTQLQYAWQFGDLEFVRQCITEDRDRGQNVDWTEMIEKAYDGKHMNIVRHIRDGGRVSVGTQLYYASVYGDLGFVSQCAAEDRDRGQNVDWGRLMKTAFDRKHMDTVCCIRDSGRASVDAQMYYSCLLGDVEFVSKHIAEDIYSEQNVNWLKMMETVYGNKHMDIVRCIRDNGRVPVDTQLYYACVYGDLEFVSQRIGEDRDRDWEGLMKTAYDNKHMDIVRCIRDSGRGSVYIQLYSSCLLGDLDFVKQCIAESRCRGKNVDWERLIKAAHDNKHMDIVHCIRECIGIMASFARLQNVETAVWPNLLEACCIGDLPLLSRCIAEDRDRGQNVNWERLMKTAYDNKHMNILRFIRDSGRGSVGTQLYYSCMLGDLEFVSQCIDEGSDRGQHVNWERLMETAYGSKHINILCCIRDSGRVSIDTQLLYQCILGDRKFVAICIAENRDREQDVNWERLTEAAYENNHIDIVRCIRNSGRGSENAQLYCACVLGDLDFVSQCIAEGRDRGQNVNWKKLIKIVFRQSEPIAKLLVGSGRFTLADLAGNTVQSKELIAFVINHTDDVNREIRPGLNTLHVACYLCVSRTWNVDADIINSELLKRADVNQKGYMGRTALHFLCHGQNEDINAILHGTNLPNELDTEKSKKGNLPTGGEIHGQTISMAIQNLIAASANVNSTDLNRQTPLHLLCLSNERLDIAIKIKSKVNIAITLIERGANIDQRDNEGRTPLAVAAQCGNDRMVSFLISKRCDINMATFRGKTPLYLSAVANKMNSAKILCEKGVDVNEADEQNVTPLAAACEQDNYQIVDLLLNIGADHTMTDMEERTALHRAAKYGSIESCERLIKSKVDLNSQDITGCTPLHLATTEKNEWIVSILLNSRCSVNTENNLGNLALHNAASIHIENTNYDKIAALVIRNGSNINHRNNYGHTPIMLSANALNFKMIRFLYACKANLKVINNMHRGIIHNIVENYPKQPRKLQKCQDIIEWLIEKGLSINATDVNKQTPLHLAAEQGKLEFVSFLVNSGSDVTVRDSFNHMPLMKALEHPDVFQYLWEKTLPDITEDDFIKLQRLSYWLDTGEEMKTQIKAHAPIVIEFNNMPQNVRKLKLRCDHSLEKWLNTEKEELPESLANWLPSLQPLTYIDHPAINHIMWGFLNDLQDDVKQEDPFVAYEITRCGSVEEKTKAFAQDESDCSCVLQNITFDMFELPIKADHPVWTAFVHLVCKEQYCDYLSIVLDGKKRLSQGKLCHRFGKAMGKVLANSAFWLKYPQLQRISAKDISAGDRRICTMHVIWSDEICPWLKIDIDLAPVIDLSKWKPSWCSQHPLLGEIECIALPKWKMTPTVNMDLMEIGVHSWGPLFHKMPEEMRQGYRLAKVVRGSAVCPQIPQTPSEVYPPEGQVLDFFDRPMHRKENKKEYEEWSNAGEFMNTYLLKQVIMHEFTEWYDQKTEGLDPPVHTDVYWARRIYEKMEEAFKHRELYSWFIPSYNLLNDDKFVQFQDAGVLYARLCRRLLTEEAADHFRKAYLGGSEGK